MFLTRALSTENIEPENNLCGAFVKYCCFRILDNGAASPENFVKTKHHRQIICSHSCVKESTTNTFFINVNGAACDSLCSCKTLGNLINVDIEKHQHLSSNKAVRKHCLLEICEPKLTTCSLHIKAAEDFAAGAKKFQGNQGKYVTQKIRYHKFEKDWICNAYRDITTLTNIILYGETPSQLSPAGEHFLSYKDDLICLFCAIKKVKDSQKRSKQLFVPFYPKPLRFDTPYVGTVGISTNYSDWKTKIPICVECKEFCVVGHWTTHWLEPPSLWSVYLKEYCAQLVKTGNYKSIRNHKYRFSKRKTREENPEYVNYITLYNNKFELYSFLSESYNVRGKTGA